MLRLLVIFAASLSYLPLYAACSADAKTEDGLRAVETRWLQALVNKDRTTLDCILSPDFMDSSMNGELRTRADVFAGLDRPRDYDQKLSIDRTTVNGDTGVVAGKNLISTRQGKPLFAIRFTDTFVYREGRWRALSAQETRIVK